jgi:hypothetical protein
MVAARTIPETQKRRTCIELIMSYKIGVSEAFREYTLAQESHK